MNLAKESLYSLIFQLTAFICATFASIVVARTLGPTSKGVISLSIMSPYLFFTIFNMTIGLGLIHRRAKNEYDIKSFVGSALLLLLLLGTIATLVFFLTIGYFDASLYKGVQYRYLLIAGATIPFLLMQYLFSSLLQAYSNIRSYNVSIQLPVYSNLVLILILASLGRLTPLMAVFAAASGFVLGGLFSLVQTLRISRGLSINHELTTRLLKDGMKVHIGALATFLYTQANLFILNYYTTPEQVGYYTAASSIANILFFFSISLETGLYPKVAQESHVEAVRLVQIATRQVLLLTACAALTLGVFAGPIIQIYGGTAFQPSVSVLILLLPGTVVFVIGKIAATFWTRHGWFFSLTIIATFTAICNIIFNILLIPRYGANGAAAATTLTYCLPSIIFVIFFQKITREDLRKLFIPTKGDFKMYHDLLSSLYGKQR